MSSTESKITRCDWRDCDRSVGHAPYTQPGEGWVYVYGGNETFDLCPDHARAFFNSVMKPDAVRRLAEARR